MSPAIRDLISPDNWLHLQPWTMKRSKCLTTTSKANIRHNNNKTPTFSNNSSTFTTNSQISRKIKILHKALQDQMNRTEICKKWYILSSRTFKSAKSGLLIKNIAIEKVLLIVENTREINQAGVLEARRESVPPKQWWEKRWFNSIRRTFSFRTKDRSQW